MHYTLGRIAYEAYNEAKGGLTYDGKPIPSWDSLPEKPGGREVMAAWESAAKAARYATKGVDFFPGGER